MDAFSLTIAKLVRSGAIDRNRYQFLIVPLLNPDGVARGHWRANLGGVDLNRDWGAFTQPETRAVVDWIRRLPAGVRPVLMLDFHSTNRNLFYVQGDEASPQGKTFLEAWLNGKETAFNGYPFEIEPRDANPGSGTTKNWFHATYGIPAFTYEAGDNTDPAAIRNAAEALATTMIPALDSSLRGAPGQ
jgi:predicted deacylase